jgi:hypothetical protein
VVVEVELDDPDAVEPLPEIQFPLFILELELALPLLDVEPPLMLLVP